MDRVKKFLRQLDSKRGKRASAVLRAIQANQLDGLNIKPLEGQKGHFRCRVGDMRFLFVRIEGQNYVYDGNFRSSIYKK